MADHVAWREEKCAGLETFFFGNPKGNRLLGRFRLGRWEDNIKIEVMETVR
jgi:hypothetical protein